MQISVPAVAPSDKSSIAFPRQGLVRDSYSRKLFEQSTKDMFRSIKKTLTASLPGEQGRGKDAVKVSCTLAPSERSHVSAAPGRQGSSQSVGRASQNLAGVGFSDPDFKTGFRTRSGLTNAMRARDHRQSIKRRFNGHGKAVYMNTRQGAQQPGRPGVRPTAKAP